MEVPGSLPVDPVRAKRYSVFFCNCHHGSQENFGTQILANLPLLREVPLHEPLVFEIPALGGASDVIHEDLPGPGKKEQFPLPEGPNPNMMKTLVFRRGVTWMVWPKYCLCQYLDPLGPDSNALNYLKEPGHVNKAL